MHTFFGRLMSGLGMSQSNLLVGYRNRKCNRSQISPAFCWISSLPLFSPAPSAMRWASDGVLRAHGNKRGSDETVLVMSYPNLQAAASQLLSVLNAEIRREKCTPSGGADSLHAARLSGRCAATLPCSCSSSPLLSSRHFSSSVHLFSLPACLPLLTPPLSSCPPSSSPAFCLLSMAAAWMAIGCFPPAPRCCVTSLGV
ncbi:hypothetical protein EYF80_037525 [Liparis tanakae]|uniref:Uncharacterized protein n=1 Tax=Liparis tanakae TaxID=230148 RepID=A0A4Z2GFI8_9TELE|nr:hypothetical protein EYF80_037525 [Liparis tanakae]